MTSEQQPSAKPLYTNDDIKALRRFAETCADGEGYDLPKETMQRLARIGLVRRCTGNIYETTNFGSSILEPEFWLTADEHDPPAEVLAARMIDVWCAAHGKQITWSKAIEIMAVITKMPDEEKQHLLFLDEVAQ